MDGKIGLLIVSETTIYEDVKKTVIVYSDEWLVHLNTLSTKIAILLLL